MTLRSGRPASSRSGVALRLKLLPEVAIDDRFMRALMEFLLGRSALRNMEAPAGSAFRRNPSSCYIEPGRALGGGSFSLNLGCNTWTMAQQIFCCGELCGVRRRMTSKLWKLEFLEERR